MTLYQFNMLDELEQLEAVWEKAVRLADRTEGDFQYVLYQIDGFYVEEKIHTPDRDRRALRSFASTNAAMFQPYLDKIDITSLVK